MYPYQGEWHVATTGTPDASGQVNTAGKTFAEYFWETIGGQQTMPQVTSNPGPGYCFIFELTGPLNRIVIPHHFATLTLLGARDTETWREVHPSQVRHFFPGIPIVREFPLQSVNEILATFEKMSPLQQEGYVCVWTNPDGSFGRVKTKHPGYVAMHHCKDAWSNKACIEAIRSGEISEVTATVLREYPEYRAMFEEATERYFHLLNLLELEYQAHRDILIQKDFALAIKNSPCTAALFQLRSGKVSSIREFLAKCQIDIMMRMLGY